MFFVTAYCIYSICVRVDLEQIFALWDSVPAVSNAAILGFMFLAAIVSFTLGCFDFVRLIIKFKSKKKARSESSSTSDSSETDK